jgi:hypothetical protein
MAFGGDATKMRKRASQLLDLATRSCCEGRPDFARLLTGLSTEIFEHARDIEQRDGNISSSIDDRNTVPMPDTA